MFNLFLEKDVGFNGESEVLVMIIKKNHLVSILFVTIVHDSF